MERKTGRWKKTKQVDNEEIKIMESEGYKEKRERESKNNNKKKKEHIDNSSQSVRNS